MLFSHFVKEVVHHLVHHFRQRAVLLTDLMEKEIMNHSFLFCASFSCAVKSGSLVSADVLQKKCISTHSYSSSSH